MAKELAELGADPDQLADWEDQADAALEAEDDEPEFELWPENEAVMRVLVLCQWQIVAAGMAGARYVGIATSEAMSVMDALQIPPTEREALLLQLRFAVSIALPVLNKER